MPSPNDSGWALKYPDPRNDTRVLISLPTLMLQDAKQVAQAEGITVAELFRRAVTGYLRDSNQVLVGEAR